MVNKNYLNHFSKKIYDFRPFKAKPIKLRIIKLLSCPTSLVFFSLGLLRLQLLFQLLNLLLLLLS